MKRLKNNFFSHESVGATEMQPERPWEYDDEVECTEVDLREVKVKKWIPIEGFEDI